MVTANDIEQELHRVGHVLSPMDIVLVNTRAGSRYGHPDYVSSGCGIGSEGAMYLLERCVRLTGTDAWSWDAPFEHAAKRYAETGDASLIRDGLPERGFMVSCFPVKIRGTSAGWARTVAILDETSTVP